MSAAKPDPAQGESAEIVAERGRQITVYRDEADPPLTPEDGRIITDLFARAENAMTRAQAIERMRQIAEEQKRLADELVSLYGLIEAALHA